MPNSQLHCLGDYVRIVCAVCNAYRPPLIACSSDDTELAEKLKKLMKVSNYLQKKVLDEKLATRIAVWQKMEEEALEDLSKLSDSQLQDLTLGIYQIKQAKSYAQEHMSEEGKYEFNVHKEEAGLIRVSIQSRHYSSKSYFLWVSYNSGHGDESITATVKPVHELLAAAHI